MGGAGGAANSGSSAQSGAGGGAIPWEPVETPWCGEGWVGLDDHTCFFAPDSVGPSASLVIFLHGMMQPDSLPQGMQNTARTAADTQGFVVLFPRGHQGLCGWDPSVEPYWCWPTSRVNVDAYALEFTSEWLASEALLESVLDISFDRRFVIGFSNGGYFASYVGLEGLLPTSGAGVVAAGRSYVDASLLSPHHPPFYIAVGAMDSQPIQDSAQNLALALAQHDWPRTFVRHMDRGHEIRVDDMNAAWTTWNR